MKVLNMPLHKKSELILDETKLKAIVEVNPRKLLEKLNKN